MSESLKSIFQKTRLVISLFLLINLAFRVGAALQPLEHIDSIALPDDTYLCLSIARSIAEGDGPVYSGAFTNGFQPLYVYLIAPAFIIFPNDDYAPLRTSLIVLSFFDTFALLLLLNLVLAISRSFLVYGLVAIAWILNPYYIKTAINGMETSVAYFMLLLMIWVYHRFTANGKSPTSQQSIMLGLVFGLGVFARIDAVMLACALTLMLFWHGRSNPMIALRNTMLIVIGGAITYGPWFLYSWMNSGDLFPVSGKAIRFMELDRAENVLLGSTWYIHTFNSALIAVIKNNTAVLIIISVLLFPTVSIGSSFWHKLQSYGKAYTRIYLFAGTFYTIHVAIIINSFASSGSIHPLGIATVVFGSIVYYPVLLGNSEIGVSFRRHSILLVPLFVFSAFLFIGYSYYIFGVWFFPRYFFPVGIVVLLIFAFILDSLLRVSKHPVNKMVIVIAIMAIGGVNFSENKLTSIYSPKNGSSHGYMSIGLWAKQFFPEGTVIGSCQSGALGYFARQCRVVNLDGVVNKKSFEALQAGRVPEYLKSEQIDFVIGWPLNMAFLSRRSYPTLMESLSTAQDVPGIMTWYSKWQYYSVLP